MRGLVFRFIAFILLTGASASLYALPYLAVAEESSVTAVARLD